MKVAASASGTQPFCEQAQEPLDRAARAQVRVAAAGDELAGLGEELDLADAAGRELEVAALEGVAVEALVLADAQPHVVRLLDGGVVEVLAPDEGDEMREEAVSRRDVARAGPGLDVGGALPGPAEAFVVALGRLHGHADGRHGGIGAQAQVGPEDVALGGHVGQGGGHAAGRADELGAGLEIGVAGVARLVEEADEVDVGGVVELPCPHLAHRERDEAAGRGQVVLGHAGDLAPREERFEFGAQRRGDGGVCEAGERARHLLERPDAPEVGERGQKRRPALGPAEARCRRRRGEGGGLGEEAVEGVLGGPGEGVGGPVRLAFDEAAEVGAAPGRAAHEPGQLAREPRQRAERVVAPSGSNGRGAARQSRGEGRRAVRVGLCHHAISGHLPPSGNRLGREVA
jgi:hypothetical protein